MDLWGVDLQDLRPIIIELKIVKTGLEIIPQTLTYYKFLKSYPDTLKHKASLSDELIHRLNDLGKNRKQLDEGLEQNPRVILVAPEFNKELVDALDFLDIDIELVEVSRFQSENSVIVAVSRPKSESPIVGRVTTKQEWNWDKYEEEGYSQKKLSVAKEIKNRLDSIVQNAKLEVGPTFTKFYISYKHGRNAVFWIDINFTSWETGDVVLGLYLEKEPDLKAEGINIEHRKTKWIADSNYWYIFFEKPSDLTPLVPIIKRSYSYIVGP